MATLANASGIARTTKMSNATGIRTAKIEPSKIIPTNIKQRSMARSVFRWIHIIFAIPIVSYIYSPFEKLPDYAPRTRYFFVPVMVLSGLWMWKGHVVRRWMGKKAHS